MTAVNPEILVWARETANLTREEAVRKLSIGDTKRVRAIDRLIAFEDGTDQPSRAVLQKMAQRYYRPLLAFYLEKPPKPANRGVDYRKLPSGIAEPQNQNLDILLRDVRVRQSMVKAALEDEDEVEYLQFVGANKISGGKPAVLHSLRRVLNLDSQTYRNQVSPAAAFELLRQRAENSGIFVLLKSDLGNYRTAIEVESFRGFVIADNIAPFIVINERDAVSARSFTLLHELVHLILGNTGVSGLRVDNEHEKFCNEVASEYLLPKEDLKLLGIQKSTNFSELEREIENFARARHLSRTMVAYSALREGLLDSTAYEFLASKFRNQWKKSKNKQINDDRVVSGGPDYYTVRQHRLGRGLVHLVHRMMISGQLTTTKAARILGVKPKNIQKLFNRSILK